MSCMVKYLYFNLISFKMLYAIWYLVFGIEIVRKNSAIHIWYSDYLDTEYYSVSR